MYEQHSLGARLAQPFLPPLQAKVLLLAPELGQSPSLSREDEDWIAANGGEMVSHAVALDYQHFTMQAILHAVLPPEMREVPSAFETVGHIAHLNLREEVLPYKELVGELERLRWLVGEREGNFLLGFGITEFVAPVCGYM